MCDAAQLYHADTHTFNKASRIRTSRGTSTFIHSSPIKTFSFLAFYLSFFLSSGSFQNPSYEKMKQGLTTVHSMVRAAGH